MRATRRYPIIPALGLLSLAAALSGCGERVERGDVEVDDGGSATASERPLRGADPDVLTPNGWRELRIGMTRDEVVAAAGEDAHPEAVGGPEPERCDEFRPLRAPEGLLVMIEDGRLTRIAITGETGIRTDRGFQVGDPGSAIREAYGADVEVSPHKYLGGAARYLSVWRTAPPAEGARGIVYETGLDGRVVRILAGGRSISYVEGCL